MLLKLIVFNKLFFFTTYRCEEKTMNKDNSKKLWKIIQEAGDYLQGQLPDHPNHPKGRNPYAHVALEVKNHFGMTYKDIPDEKFNEVINYIEEIKSNPE